MFAFSDRQTVSSVRFWPWLMRKLRGDVLQEKDIPQISHVIKVNIPYFDLTCSKNFAWYILFILMWVNEIFSYFRLIIMRLNCAVIIYTCNETFSYFWLTTIPSNCIDRLHVSNRKSNEACLIILFLPLSKLFLSQI